MSPSSQKLDDMPPLPIGYVPSRNDVIVGTGREAKKHIGNKKFHNTVKRYIGDYSKRPSKLEKGRIISQIIHDIKKQSPTGTPFVKNVGGRWYAVGSQTVREKISQSLRNGLHSKYRSSMKAKKQRRIQICHEIDNAVHEMMQQRGNLISERTNTVSAQMKISGKMPDEEVCDLFTEANIDILEALKKTVPCHQISESNKRPYSLIQ
jgi:hypothetical protein